MNDLISLLFSSRTQVHIFHLQTSSYSIHKALDGYYSEISEIIDGLVESYQGKYGIIINYTASESLIENAQRSDLIKYFSKLADLVDIERKKIPQDSYIQNQIDELVELIHTTNYKLKFLN